MRLIQRRPMRVTGSPPTAGGPAAWEALEPRTLLSAIPSAAPGPQVSGFTLIDADADQPLGPLSDGQVLDLSTLPTRHLNIRADTDPDAASVRFGYDGDSNSRLENAAPFALASNDGPDYFAWTPAVGEHEVSATAYALKGAAGAAGPTASLHLRVIDGVQRLTVAATPVGTTALKLTWNWPAGASADLLRYRITFRPGIYGGRERFINVAAPAGSAVIEGLLPFALYSVKISARTATGTLRGIATASAWTAAPATQQRYLYVAEAPIDKRGFRDITPGIQVFDINDGHRWVKTIPLPKDVYNIRGITASAATGRMYLTFFNTPADQYQPGGLLCIDLNSGQVLWRRQYSAEKVPAPDRLALTPDGATIYMPAGEASGDSRFWRVIDASTGQILGRINHVSNPHNTITSLDGRFAFLEGQEKGPEPADVRHTVALVDTTTNQIIRRIGPFRDVVRPYTVNGSATMLFATLNNFVGFQVADVTTGKVLYTVPVPGVKQPTSTTQETDCHGIALTPDEKQVWLCDRVRGGIDVFDVSDLSSGPPRYVGFVRTRQGGRDINGHSDPNASNDPTNVPGWIAASYDGRYMYPETGEIIDVATRKVIGQLRGRVPNDAGALVPGPYTHSKFMLEVDFDQGAVSRVSDQFAIGRVR